MRVEIEDLQSDLPIDLEQVRSTTLYLLNFLKMEGDEIAIHFVDAEAICQYHKQFFDDPSFTDCITLPIGKDGSGYYHLGECIICPKAASDFSEEDPHRELTLYLIHTLLHLKGYDDVTPEEQTQMREQEALCMKALEKEDRLLT